MEVDKFRAFKFEDSGEHISHLLNTNDTLIIREKSWLNTQNIKANILLFEVMVGLKVNFHKKHYCEDEYSPIVAKGGCPNYGKLEKSFDVAIIDVQNRLSCWKNQHLSIGGRVVINN